MVLHYEPTCSSEAILRLSQMSHMVIFEWIYPTPSMYKHIKACTQAALTLLKRLATFGGVWGRMGTYRGPYGIRVKFMLRRHLEGMSPQTTYEPL